MTFSLTQLYRRSVEHFGVLENQDLVEMILSHLRFEHGILVKMVKVSTLFRDAGMKFLWEAVDTRHLITYMTDTARRQYYASFIAKVQFFDHEEIWAPNNIACPQFSKIRSLELYGTCLQVSQPQEIIPFAQSALRELRIWTDAGSTEDNISPHRDSLWVSHLTTTCVNMTHLKLEVALRVSSADMTAFFSNMRKVKVLRVGHELDSVLDRDAVGAILVMPSLEDLSMDLPLISSFLNEVMATKAVHEILPEARKLEITFLVNENLAPETLLAEVSRLESLSVTLDSTMPDRMIALHPAFGSLLSTLPQLRALELKLASNIYVTCSALATITSNEKLAYLTIASNGPGLHQPSPPIFLTGHDLLQTPVTLKFLDALESLDLPTYIEATYDEALILTHQIMATSPRYMDLLHFRVNEAASFGWPEDYNDELCEEPDLIWKASSKGFAPDPVPWDPRELNSYVDENGGIVPLDQVASDGSYNHLSTY
jgi:hypothetical protein